MYCARCKKLVPQSQAEAVTKPDGTAYYCPECKRRLIYLGQERSVVSRPEAIEKYDRETVHEIPTSLRKINFARNPIETRIDELLDILKYAPDNAHARFDLALIYYSQKQLDKALAEFETILTAVPDHAPTLHKLLNICTAEEKTAAAINYALKILESEPENTEVLFHLALLYLNGENIDAASEQLHKILNLDPEHISAKALMEELEA